MAYILKEKLADRDNYGSQRDPSVIDWLAAHFTGNDGDTDENNGKYFSKPVTPRASAHYFVDDDSVTRSVPDDHVAYSVGGSKYNNNGGRLYGSVTNTNSLSIELCDNVKNGVVYPSAGTIENAIMLFKSKMVEHGIDKAHVIRHYDVNGKPCPKYWVDDEKWEREFHSKLTGWAFYNNQWYWLDDNGNVVKSAWIQHNNKWYHLNINGIMDANTWIQNDSGTWSYAGSDGDALIGWQQLAWNGVTSWYYFDENGNMLASQWINSSGKDYYLTTSGAMATNAYVKSTSQNIYYWVNWDGIWEPQWDTPSPDLKRYRLAE